MRVGALLIIVAMLRFGAAGAAESLPDCGPSPISVGFYGCCYFHQQGAGIDTEIFNALHARTSCTFHFHEMSRARVWHDLEHASLDMSSMGIETPERAEFSWFIPYVTIQDIVEDDRLVIGVVRSFRHGATIDRLIEEVKARNRDRVIELVDEMALFRMLQADRVQVIFTEKHLFDYATKALSIDDAIQVDIAPSELPKPRCLVLSKARFSREQFERWRHLVETLRTDGTLAAILAKYLAPEDIPPLLALP